MANGKISKFTYRRAAEYACQDRQDRRTEYQGVAAQMPDRIKPSRNGGGTDGIARQQGTGIFCARCRGDWI
ncbi:hypothetical protein BB032_05580 [Neisseria gonorrhoeae]|uniref:hypothetical protein n=1 Tax=Neisseria gonorrhoeae TaxID=485 RepID=UPI00067B8C68|nr:hypothetical protein [Neisseria gonorrhoeae]OHZ78728.1 hypothetical protein BBZ65_05405 [Neisseria gonorrhoeae]OHZ80573.1 hypothetical protein BB009_11440 [Neisseria gonorrhoeae]OHZ80651.1 hypothetical protein BBZ95_07895 [Neisseria gonorrhoeae]OIA03201.1 hypothetical protein BBZ76_05905 [Neisseria gonorrhoeae]OIA14135.1 hypothetical protein BBZ69_04830 [Neisseria gonorrhoeae]